MLSLSFLLTNPALAADIGLPKTSQQDRGIKVPDVQDPVEVFGAVFTNIIVLLFTVGAIGFVIMFLWGAVDWILSGGDKEKIAGARKRITTAIAGLVLLSLTFVVMLVVGQILGLKPLYDFKFPIPRLSK